MSEPLLIGTFCFLAGFASGILVYMRINKKADAAVEQLVEAVLRRQELEKELAEVREKRRDVEQRIEAFAKNN